MLPADEIAAELTAIFRTPSGTMSLRPLQGRCLLGATENVPHGLFTNASVGLGKSLMIALLTAVCGGTRPLVLTQACNIRQLRDDFENYRLHFQLPTNYRMESYETISTHPGILDDLQPTLVLMDEAHRVKRLEESGRGRMFARWRAAHPDVPMGILSGSPGENFQAFAHLLVWGVPALRSDRGGPIPVLPEGDEFAGFPEGWEWKALCKRMKEDPEFRAEFWAQIRSTPGVVISAETYTDTPLRIQHTILDAPEQMEPHWQRLRDFGEAPDGWLLEGPSEQWGLSRLVSGSGAYYEHVPRPPAPYREARRAWSGFVRTAIEAGKLIAGGPYDTEGAVGKACLAGRLPRGVYDAWVAQIPLYTPTTQTTWLSDHVLEFAEKWGREHAPGCIIWTEHTCFGEELSKRTKWPYYGKKAQDARRRQCRLARDPVIICSTDSCGTGTDGLQRHYWQSLFMNPPSNQMACEQWFGRIHRPGQLKDAVVEVVYGCLEDWIAFCKAEASAGGAEEDLTSPRKLKLATHARTHYPEAGTSAAWEKPEQSSVVVVI